MRDVLRESRVERDVTPGYDIRADRATTLHARRSSSMRPCATKPHARRTSRSYPLDPLRGRACSRAGVLVRGLAAACCSRPPASAAVVPAPGERAASVRAPHCTLKGAKTIAANRHVRVFSARRALARGLRLPADGRIARTRSATAAASARTTTSIDSAVVAGNFVALNVRTCSLYDSESSVELVNLRDGRGALRLRRRCRRRAPRRAYDAIRGMVRHRRRAPGLDRRARRARRHRRGRGAPPRARHGG